MMTVMDVERELAPPPFATDEARWSAVVRRDRHADGTFYYGVSTTGVYCRPSCASRLARRDHVSFHETCAAAERAGFRPCKRCRPNGPALEAQHAAAVAAACRLIETADQAPGLDQLAQAAGLSRFHFHRVFTEATGLDAEGIRVRAPRPPPPPRAPPRGSRDGCHLRRGLWLQQPLLRINGRLPGHVSRSVPERWARNNHPLRGRRVFTGIGPGRGNRQGCVRDSAGRRSRRARPRPAGSVSACGAPVWR